MIKAKYLIKIYGTPISNSKENKSKLIKETKSNFNMNIDTEDISESHFKIIKSTIIKEWVEYMKKYSNKFKDFSYELKVNSLIIK